MNKRKTRARNISIELCVEGPLTLSPCSNDPLLEMGGMSSTSQKRECFAVLSNAFLLFSRALVGMLQWTVVGRVSVLMNMGYSEGIFILVA